MSPLSGREQQQLPWGHSGGGGGGLGSVCAVVNANEAWLSYDVLSVYNQPPTLSPTITLSPSLSHRPIYLKVLRVHTPSSTFV